MTSINAAHERMEMRNPVNTSSAYVTDTVKAKEQNEEKIPMLGRHNRVNQVLDLSKHIFKWQKILDVSSASSYII